ncbi:MAG TPA: imidazole glycerol phosphate synthase subunit HisH [Desulfovibrio sp.]|jgi:glutamine amidotransferase|nr:imidazole glycerol phosphate synthase subunit HisH [Desulfovibrio sp.]
MNIGIIDYGVGNLGSVQQALETLRTTATLITRAVDMHTVDALILPGVGSFAECAQNLDNGGWTQAIRHEVLERNKPLLGICLGMQLLASCSMEGATESTGHGGLDLIPGRVEHLRDLGCTLRVPHVGWNDVKITAKNATLFNDIPDGTDFYFVHSYAFVPADTTWVQATTSYGIPVTAAVRRGRVWGTQFHPEKSSRAGLRLLRNFIETYPC